MTPKLKQQFQRWTSLHNDWDTLSILGIGIIFFFMAALFDYYNYYKLIGVLLIIGFLASIMAVLFFLSRKTTLIKWLADKPIRFFWAALAICTPIVLISHNLIWQGKSDILVEAHGLLYDLFVFGVVLTAFQKITSKNDDIKRWQEELDDYRGWTEDEAAYRVAGLVRRLMDAGVDIDFNDLHGGRLKKEIIEELVKNFTFASLGGANLRGADLGEVKLKGAKLEGADLFRADLGGADLFRADLGGANLRSAKLGGAILYESKMLETNLRGADLEGANLHGAKLRGADLMGAKLGGAHLFSVDLGEAYLYGAKLSGANLRFADLGGATLFKVDLGGADLRNTKLEGADLRGAILRGANLRGAKDLIYDQLLSTKSLFQARGIDEEWLELLKKEKPCLFTPEGCK